MSITIDLEDKKIKINANVIDLMNSYKQLNINDCEAGGILIGRESKETGNTIIEYATEPYHKDKRTRNSFLRKDKKHIQFYKQLYEENNGIYAYIGEWHTHSEDYPNYSRIDSNNWNKISNKNNDKDKVYYHVIVGNKEIRAWQFNCRTKLLKRVL